MVLNALISVVYSTVVESWALAVFSAKFFILGTIAYAYYKDRDILETVLDLSEYFVTLLVIVGFLISRTDISAPSGGIFSSLVALIYFLVLFWNY